ncbi:hypothetical protein [Candidatus Deianiraea vastatrix]|uniref:Uncharacterized protein n=1 Tax=Candidatus Deianiraea vastatrix TaxID=2163644 RepID=A0A5B8XCC7_9RICK|nr:hypothetical protein [Candidatus Deianiraea vastatrix]QED22999.1 hypothetical protein Deia_00191 [Candidatus Deianiraea vastatrix]
MQIIKSSFKYIETLIIAMFIALIFNISSYAAKPRLLKKDAIVCTSKENLARFAQYARNHDINDMQTMIENQSCYVVPCDCLQYEITNTYSSDVVKIKVWMPARKSEATTVWTVKKALNEFDN